MRSLDRLLFPRSIAFIGGRECDIAIRKTRQLGFPGRIFAVNPRRDSVGGVPTVATVADLPEAPDAAFVAIKREPTIDVVRDLARRGAGGAVVFASGFAETGSADLQAALVEAADGMPFLGPNCNGYVNLLSRAVLWADDHGGGPMERGVVVAAQSGNIAVNLTMLRRAVPLAGVFALGNQADVDLARMIETFARDERVTAIGLHIEGLKDVPAFLRAAQEARARGKPIVALKTGRSQAGARITLSHTSSLAGEDRLYDALFARCGIARVDTITAFAETLKLLHVAGPLPGTRLVSMSCSGGEAALIADLAERRAVSFPAFDAAGRARVEATLNDLVGVGNPLDYQTFIWGDEDKLAATFGAALQGGFDLGLLILDVPAVAGADPSSWITTAEAFRRAVRTTGVRGALVATLPECLPEALALSLAEDEITPLVGLDDALTAIEAAGVIGRALEGPQPAPLLPGHSGEGAGRLLTEAEAKAQLAAFGLPVPAGETCRPEEAAAVAARLGFPVVVKAASLMLAHKSEAGGVALDLRTPEAVAAAAARMAALADQVLVERMATGAVCELIVGVKADPQFGLALVIGAGGVLAELIDDTVTLLLPASGAEIGAALGRLKAGRLIAGFRGRSGDRAATVAAIEAIARFAEARAGSLVELDVNPLLVLPEGCVAVDALMRLDETGERGA